MPIDIDSDIGMDGMMNGATVDGGLEKLGRWVRLSDGHVDGDRKATDAAWCIGAHFLENRDAQAAEVEFFASSDDAHDSRHASPESGSD